MPSHIGFLADIIEHPNDDTPRLIYADWLDDHGDADRAEFIRLQVEAARLPEGDPKASDLESKAEGILAEFENEWLGEWSNRLVRWRFRRGFLDELTLLPGHFLAMGEELFGAWPVRRVRFVEPDGWEVGEDAIDQITASPTFHRVRGLDASGSHTSSWATFLSQRPYSSGLRELTLSDESQHGRDPLTYSVLVSLCYASHLARLESLDVSTRDGGMYGFSARVVELIAGSFFARRLRSLVLDGQPLSDEAVERLARDPVFARLERLRLADALNPSPEAVTVLLGPSRLDRLRELCIGWECDLAELAAAPRFRQLKRLDLWPSNHLTYSQKNWSRFAEALEPGHLTHLGLAHDILGVESVDVLLKSPGLKGLKGLAIWGGRGVGDRVLQLVAEGHLELTALDLPRAGVSVDGIAWLAASPRLSQLASIRLWWDEVWPSVQRDLLRSSHFSSRMTRLDLAGWNLREAGLELVADNPHLSGLTSLHLRSCNPDEKGMVALITSPHMRRLTSLRLSSTSDDVVAVLGDTPGLPRLREVVIDSRVKQETISRLRKRFGPRLIVDPTI